MRKITLLFGIILGLSLIAFASGGIGKGRCGDGPKGGHGGGPMGDHGRGPKGGRGGFSMMRDLAELDLNDEQMSKIASLLKSNRENKQSKRQEGENLRTEAVNVVLSDSCSDEDVNSLIKKGTVFHTKKITSHINMLRGIAAILTSEQKAQLKEAFNKKQAKRKSHHDRMERMEKFRKLMKNCK